MIILLLLLDYSYYFIISVNTGAITSVCMHFLNMHVIILVQDNIIMLLS